MPSGEKMRGEPVWDALPAQLRERARRERPRAYSTLTGEAPPLDNAPELQEETLEKLKALGYVQ
jgi:hypothetical protein